MEEVVKNIYHELQEQNWINYSWVCPPRLLTRAATLILGVLFTHNPVVKIIAAALLQ